MDDLKKEFLSVNYLNYFDSVKQIVGFVSGFVKQRDQFSYKDYRKFASTVANLVGNLVDDYMAGDLFSTQHEGVPLSATLTKLRKQFEHDSQRIFENHDDDVTIANHEIDLSNDLIDLLEKSLQKQPHNKHKNSSDKHENADGTGLIDIR